MHTDVREANAKDNELFAPIVREIKEKLQLIRAENFETLDNT